MYRNIKEVITKPHPTNPELTYYLTDKIHKEKIWIAFRNMTGYLNYLQLKERMAFVIRKSINELKRRGIEGDEGNIKKVIYDKWT